MYLKQLEDIKYDLSQQTCIFKIHDAPILRGNYLLLNIYVRPLTGLYESIEFRPHIYLNLFDNFQPPKILNDRKIYHPNIDFINGEILVPEIINWNPSYTYFSSYHRLGKQLSRLKYTLIEPNPDTVPNNQWNIDAASIFILSRDKSYREKIIENSPAVLEQKVFMVLGQEDMEDEDQNRTKRFLSFHEILPLDRTRSMIIEEDDDL